ALEASAALQLPFSWIWMPLVALALRPLIFASTRTTSPFCVKLTVPLTELPFVGARTAVADCFLLKKLLVPLQLASSTDPQIRIQTDFIDPDLHRPARTARTGGGFSTRLARCQMRSCRRIASRAGALP